MSELCDYAIDLVYKSRKAFTRFITINDTGQNGAHQAGFYIPKCAWSLLFDTPGVKGSNKDKLVKIRWQKVFETDSRFIYYGGGTRNEYRLTRFGKGFPFFSEDNVGDLLVIAQMEDDYYEAVVLQSDDDLEYFFTTFDLSPQTTNQLINKNLTSTPDEKLQALFNDFVSLRDCFPSTLEMGAAARELYLQAYKMGSADILSDPDKLLLRWVDSEYQLFKAFEVKLYGERIKTAFASVDELIEFSNSMLNRRKSRAGKSLEHHLSNVFSTAQLKFEEQVVTEENKRPDFIFPGSSEYRNFTFPAENLVFLGAKTTCKDRWRQIINEADRIETKHLFTLQQGISKNQLTEMYANGVCLVVPKDYVGMFDVNFQSRIFSLDKFIHFVAEKQQ
ncbi:type II restriction endonuclease [uncultured Bacteroides sp.]|uniref:type II restriction endonuclease n=1 Tax=uncultured Bacteroides sp. TaxID=162156 RepID=UPI002AA89C9C|nr:type II restriction endonuclease [uncultured Bacteroides sp.]